jgi:hypothetical protein
VLKRYEFDMKLKSTLFAAVLTASLVAPAFANEEAVAAPLPQFTAADTQMLFEQDAAPMQLAALSPQEMKETEGAALWFAPIAFQVGRVVAGRIAHHSAHHTFGSLGRLPHLQMNYWRPGVSGSGGAIRLPLPNRSFFRP